MSVGRVSIVVSTGMNRDRKVCVVYRLMLFSDLTVFSGEVAI